MYLVHCWHAMGFGVDSKFARCCWHNRPAFVRYLKHSSGDGAHWLSPGLSLLGLLEDGWLHPHVTSWVLRLATHAFRSHKRSPCPLHGQAGLRACLAPVIESIMYLHKCPPRVVFAAARHCNRSSSASSLPVPQTDKPESVIFHVRNTCSDRGCWAKAAAASDFSAYAHMAKLMIWELKSTICCVCCSQTVQWAQLCKQPT